MTPIELTLRRIAADLNAAQVQWAVVGGLAVSVRTEPRFTRDVDLAVAVSGDEEAEALVHRLQGSGYRAIASVEHQSKHRLATIRLEAPRVKGRTSGVVVDLLFASSGIEHEVVNEAEVLEVLRGLFAPVARTGHLIATKVLARDDIRRPQDVADLRALAAGANATELKRAERALALIAKRRFNRDKDLKKVWRSFLAGR